jgi:hypothetical protein
MAVITLAENQLGRAIRRMKEWLQAKDHEPEYFSLAEFSRQPEVKAWLEANVQLPWLEQ